MTVALLKDFARDRGLIATQGTFRKPELLEVVSKYCSNLR